MSGGGLLDPRAAAIARISRELLERYEAEVLGRRITSLEDGLGLMAWARRQPEYRARRHPQGSAVPASVAETTPSRLDS